MTLLKQIWSTAWGKAEVLWFLATATAGTDKRDYDHTVRVQVQGKKLTRELHIPLQRKDLPITATETIAALHRLKNQLSKTELKLTDLAFEKAERWITQVAQAGGIGPIGSRSFTNRGVNPNDARVDVELLRGHNLVSP